MSKLFCDLKIQVIELSSEMANDFDCCTSHLVSQSRRATWLSLHWHSGHCFSLIRNRRD